MVTRNTFCIILLYFCRTCAKHNELESLSGSRYCTGSTKTIKVYVTATDDLRLQLASARADISMNFISLQCHCPRSLLCTYMSKSFGLTAGEWTFLRVRLPSIRHHLSVDSLSIYHIFVDSLSISHQLSKDSLSIIHYLSVQTSQSVHLSSSVRGQFVHQSSTVCGHWKASLSLVIWVSKFISISCRIYVDSNMSLDTGQPVLCRFLPSV